MEKESSGRRAHFESLTVTHGEEPAVGPDEVGDVTVPIHLASTFAVPGIDTDLALEDLDPDQNQYLYSRLSNPTRRALEHRLAALEGGEYGLAFASGSAAINATITAHVEPGAHVVAFDDLYGGTKTMLSELFANRFEVDVSFVDATDLDEVRAAMREETALVWMETPTNPTMKLCDIEAIAEIVGDDAVFGVDNTFASPYFQNPLDLGADVVVHSTTKFLNGHTDSIGGAVVTSDPAIHESVEAMQQVQLGNMLAPFDAYQTLRGTKTLALRMRQHEENAMAVAEFLDDDDRVNTVYYPGLDSHPQHDLAARQMSGFGGVLSIDLDTDLDGVERFLDALDSFALAVSLGGVESLVEHPASMTHSPLDPEDRDALGITDSLLRFSVGVENTRDLLADLEYALDAMVAPAVSADD